MTLQVNPLISMPLQPNPLTFSWMPNGLGPRSETLSASSVNLPSRYRIPCLAIPPRAIPLALYLFVLFWWVLGTCTSNRLILTLPRRFQNFVFSSATGWHVFCVVDLSDPPPESTAPSRTWGSLTSPSGSSITTLYHCIVSSDAFVPRWPRSAVACHSCLLPVQQLELLSVLISSCS